MADETQGTPVRIDPAAMRAHAIAALEEIGTLQPGRLSKAKRVNVIAKQIAQTVPNLARDVDLLASGVEQLLGERAALARQLLDATAEVKDLVAERDPAMVDEAAPCASCGALPGTRHEPACFYMHVQVGTVGDIAAARELYDRARDERNAMRSALRAVGITRSDEHGDDGSEWVVSLDPQGERPYCSLEGALRALMAAGGSEGESHG